MSSPDVGTILLKRAGDFGHLEDLKLVELTDVVVALERQAAFLTGLNFADVVLEVLEGGELARPDDHVVAKQSDRRIAANHAFEHAAAGDVADLRHADDLADLEKAERRFAAFGREHAAQSGLNVIHGVVDDVVVADVDAFGLGNLARLSVGADVKPMITADDAAARFTSDSLMPPTAA